MTTEYGWFLMALCLVSGYLFGNFFAANLVAHCLAGVSAWSVGTGVPGAENLSRHLGKPAGAAVTVGDILKTVLACWFCYRLAAPELGRSAILYGGFGVVLGHIRPLRFRLKGGPAAAVVVTWIFFYLPVTGALCCLAGVVVALGTRRTGWGVAAVPALAAPLAWLQFGTLAGALVGGGALLLVWQQWASQAGGNQHPGKNTGYS